MEKIRFITDSASDMNHPREDVTILPLHIRFGDDEYADGVTISHREFYEKLIECDTLPTTSLVSPAVFEDAYEPVSYTHLAIPGSMISPEKRYASR